MKMDKINPVDYADFDFGSDIFNMMTAADVLSLLILKLSHKEHKLVVDSLIQIGEVVVGKPFPPHWKETEDD